MWRSSAPPCFAVPLDGNSEARADELAQHARPPPRRCKRRPRRPNIHPPTAQYSPQDGGGRRKRISRRTGRIRAR
eukprot:1481667-Pyramimonas_sp.AAC.2